MECSVRFGGQLCNWTADNNERQNNEPLTAPKKNGGGSANINNCATNKLWWVKTV